MSCIKSSKTSPELMLLKYLRKSRILGLRTKNSLYGKPDFIHNKSKTAIFVDGCFWHKCSKCFVRPKSNRKFWDEKIAKNVKRDKKVSKMLKENGWIVMRIWEHDVKENIEIVTEKIKKATVTRRQF